MIAAGSNQLEPRPGLLTAAGNWLLGGPLLGPMIAFFASAIVAVGPWLVSVLALGLVSLTLSPVLGRSAMEDLRLTVVYAFGISLIATAPVAALTARLVRRAADERAGQLVAELYAVSGALSGLSAALLALVAVFGFGILRIELSVAFVVLTATASLLWTSLAVLSALQRHWRIVSAFGIGTLVALACALMSTIWTPTVEVLLWCFALGLLIGHHLMAAWTVGGIGLSTERLVEAFALVRKEIIRSRVLFFGVALAMIGVWVDKLVFWFGPSGMVARSGFHHFAPYDSAMFIAHLSMIPTLAAWFLFQRTELEPRVQRFWRLLEARPTHSALAAEGAGLQDLVWRGVFRILFVQVVCSAILIMLSPQIVRGLGMQFDQIELLQVGILAVLLQSLFFLSSAIIMLCNRGSMFFRLNLAFFALNLALGVLCYAVFGVSAYPVFIASLLCGAVSFILAYRALGDFLFIVFVRGNDGLYAEDRWCADGVSPGAVLRSLFRRTAADQTSSPIGPSGGPEWSR